MHRRKYLKWFNIGVNAQERYLQWSKQLANAWASDNGHWNVKGLIPVIYTRIKVIAVITAIGMEW